MIWIVEKTPVIDPNKMKDNVNNKKSYAVTVSYTYRVLRPLFYRQNITRLAVDLYHVITRVSRLS
jgi:hypothetical protein